MLDINIRECEQCASVKSTLEKLDREIAFAIKNHYLSFTILSNKRYSNREIKSLLRYRNILSNLYWNKDYYEGYDYRIIVSKIKTLI